MNPDTVQFWVIMFGGVFGLYAVSVFFARWCLYSPAISADKLSALHVGLSMAEVRSLLGKPRRENTHHNQIEWLFGHRLKRHVLVVSFNSEGAVSQFQHLKGTPQNRREVS